MISSPATYIWTRGIALNDFSLPIMRSWSDKTSMSDWHNLGST